MLPRSILALCLLGLATFQGCCCAGAIPLSSNDEATPPASSAQPAAPRAPALVPASYQRSNPR